MLLLFALKAQYNWIFALASLYTLGIGIYLFSEVRGHAKNAAQVKTKTSADKNVSAADIKSVLLLNPILVSLAVVNFLYVGIETSLGAWVYTFLQRAEALNGETASAAVSMLWIGLTLGRMASTKACLRINPKYVTMGRHVGFNGYNFYSGNSACWCLCGTAGGAINWFWPGTDISHPYCPECYAFPGGKLSYNNRRYRRRQFWGHAFTLVGRL